MLEILNRTGVLSTHVRFLCVISGDIMENVLRRQRFDHVESLLVLYYKNILSIQSLLTVYIKVDLTLEYHPSLMYMKLEY